MTYKMNGDELNMKYEMTIKRTQKTSWRIPINKDEL